MSRAICRSEGMRRYGHSAPDGSQHDEACSKDQRHALAGDNERGAKAHERNSGGHSGGDRPGTQQ
jgi:hypothetical protein